MQILVNYKFILTRKICKFCEHVYSKNQSSRGGKGSGDNRNNKEDLASSTHRIGSRKVECSERGIEIETNLTFKEKICHCKSRCVFSIEEGELTFDPVYEGGRQG